MDTKAAFEKAWKEKYGYELRWEAALSGYRYKNENAAWWAWQASRESVVICTPTPDYNFAGKSKEYQDGFCHRVHELNRQWAESITSHGIRIKGKTD